MPDIGKIAHKATSDGSAKAPLFHHERWMRDGVDDQDDEDHDGDDHDETHAWRSNTEARRHLQWLVQEGRLEVVGRARGTKYIPTDEDMAE